MQVEGPPSIIGGQIEVRVFAQLDGLPWPQPCVVDAGEEGDEARPNPSLLADCDQQLIGLAAVHHDPRVHGTLGRLRLGPHLGGQWQGVGLVEHAR